MLGALQQQVMRKAFLVLSWRGSGWGGHGDTLKQTFSA